MESVIISTVIIVGAALIYKIFVLCYASKCKIFKCNCKDGIVINREIEQEPSIKSLNVVTLNSDKV